MTKLFVVLSVFALLCGCKSYQQVNLSPTPPVASSDAGKNATVSVRVIDERLSESLGSDEGIPAPFTYPVTEMTAAQDLAAVVKQQVMDGLRKKGFNPVSVYSSQGKGPRLTVEVYHLEYFVRRTEGVVEGVVKAVAVRGDYYFERRYRNTKVGKGRVSSFPNAKAREQLCNDVLSDLLRQLLEDPELLKFLADFSPTPPVASSDAGKNATVSVRVIDERTFFPTRVIDELTPNFLYGPTELALVLQPQVIDGLRMKGFDALPMYYGEGKDPRLTVEVRLLERSGKGAIKAIAVRGATYYERNYRTEKVVPYGYKFFSSDPKANEQWVNDAFSDLLRQLLEDPELLRFLAG